MVEVKITPDTHLDHALTPAHVEFILATFGEVDAFKIRTVAMPVYLPSLPCALIGPLTGDEIVTEDRVHYTRRGNRSGLSRMIFGPPVPSRNLSVIIGPDDNGEIILYTAYGGPVAPREPFDPGLTPGTPEHDASVEFWARHALAE